MGGSVGWFCCHELVVERRGSVGANPVNDGG